ncbi:MAG: tetratricopeptide repeat protein [Thermodesulfobacteriota bacterium]
MAKKKVQHKATIQKKKGQDKPAQVKVSLFQRHALKFLISLCLIVVILAVFWKVHDCEFVSFDDYPYVAENPYVKAGLTFKSVTWAFTAMHANNWHPLTWLSHMLDCELYGLNPAGHHLTNLLFHIGNTLLLFLVLKWMTGILWRSGFVAALFALHPLHVESVAWVAERKDVLSTFFWMLTMWAYVRYAKGPRIDRYLLVLLFFALGLLSKPMLVTLPFVLLLLDYWPLERFQFGQLSGNRNPYSSKSTSSSNQRALSFRLVLEKVPFLALSAVSSFLTFIAQQKGGTVKSFELFSLENRIANALVSYVNYIEKMIWPHPLAILYPHPGMLPIWQVIGAGLLLVCVSVLAIHSARRHPYLVMGWLWYLGTLVPVIGLVQVGMQAMADRYTYVPLIGLFVIIAWAVPDILKEWRYRKIVFNILASLVLSIFMILTRMQIQYWKNSIALFGHTVKVTVNNHIAEDGLGLALAHQGRLDEAIAHFAESLRIYPNYYATHYNLGLALALQGNIEKAMIHYAEALRLKPNYAEAHNKLGIALIHEGRKKEAIAHFTEAVQIKPDYVEAYSNLGDSLAEQGRIEEAISHYNKALSINPDSAEIHYNLGVALAQKGKIQEGIAHLSRALRIKPHFPEAHFSLALAYLMAGNRSSALAEYEILRKIKPDMANSLLQKISK